MRNEKSFNRDDLIQLAQDLKDYTLESKNILGHDEREASDFVDIFLSNREVKNKEAYLILLGRYYDSGFFPKLATSEDSIKKIIKEDCELILAKAVVEVSVDFDKCEIHYTYIDIDDEVEKGRLHFEKLEIVE